MGANDCTLYGPRGETLGKLTISQPLPTLRAEGNDVRFSCGPGRGPPPRVKVTLFSLGEEL